jgi:tRNA-dihydrouridine synthase A
MLPYIDYWAAKGLKLNKISRHMLQLFAGQSGSKAWKRYLTENSYLPGAGSDIVREALAQVSKPLASLSLS